jgi:hypothetical protein
MLPATRTTGLGAELVADNSLRFITDKGLKHKVIDKIPRHITAENVKPEIISSINFNPTST